MDFSLRNLVPPVLVSFARIHNPYLLRMLWILMIKHFFSENSRDLMKRIRDDGGFVVVAVVTSLMTGIPSHDDDC